VSYTFHATHKVRVELRDASEGDRPVETTARQGAEATGPGEPATGDRENVVAVLDELSGWGPHDRHSMFQRWHRGALSLVHLNVLAALEAEGPLSMTHLAETLDVSVASATGIVDRMERRGLVERRHDTEDRRVVLVELEQAGRDVFRDLSARRRERLGRVLRELSDDDLAAFLRGIRALRAARARLMATEASHAADCPESEPAEGSPEA
jgi:DNA-binding MarR family transcriptional regulator